MSQQVQADCSFVRSFAVQVQVQGTYVIDRQGTRPGQEHDNTATVVRATLYNTQVSDNKFVNSSQLYTVAGLAGAHFVKS